MRRLPMDFFISCDRSISDRILAPLSAVSAEPALTFSAVHFGRVAALSGERIADGGQYQG